ncbi:MAG: metalloregulator ArsR/SmtB family transcription factor [Acidimicrobiales bacterium]
MPTPEQLTHAVDAFRMLADPTRVKVAWALICGERSVKELADIVEATPTAVSQHLAKLRLAGLVTVRREGTFAFYSMADAHVGQLLEEALFHADHAVDHRPDHAGTRPPRPSR